MRQAIDIAPASTERSEFVRLACHAMASRFELVLHGNDPAFLRAAGEEALAEIERLDGKLSRFKRNSDIGRINAVAAREAVRVDARLFDLLLTCRRLYDETDGAFDITVGPLMKVWGFTQRTGHVPAADILEDARQKTGMHLIDLDEVRRTVGFAREGVSIDLGAIGKGYAVDEAILLLREAGVTSAFLHGGTSTMAAIGAPPEADAWLVAIPRPNVDDSAGDGEGVLRTVPLRDAALSVSAVWGREFMADGVSYGHILDPRIGRPVDGALLAAVEGPSGTIADALSTALLVRGARSGGITRMYPNMWALVVSREASIPNSVSSAEPFERGVEFW